MHETPARTLLIKTKVEALGTFEHGPEAAHFISLARLQRYSRLENLRYGEKTKKPAQRSTGFQESLRSYGTGGTGGTIATSVGFISFQEVMI